MKKTYITPQTEVLGLSASSAMLAGSSLTIDKDKEVDQWTQKKNPWNNSLWAENEEN